MPTIVDKRKASNLLQRKLERMPVHELCKALEEEFYNDKLDQHVKDLACASILGELVKRVILTTI